MLEAQAKIADNKGRKNNTGYEFNPFEHDLKSNQRFMEGNGVTSVL